MRIEPCFYCGRPSYPSKGITFVRNDAKSFRFCRSKCHKNFKMKRQPRKLKWTKTHRMYAGKEMLVDTTVQFAARRNIPIRYDRELWARTLQAMERVKEIRARRERVFYKKRMAGKRAREIAENRRLVAQNEHLLRGIEKGRAAELAIDQNIGTEESPITLASGKSKVFGVQARKLKHRIDGRVEEMSGTDEMDVG